MNTKAFDEMYAMYQKKYGNFLTSYHPNPKARWTYLVYGSPEYISFITQLPNKRPNHRRIFPDEIVFDIDTDSNRNKQTVFTQLVQRLTNNKINYNVWKNPSGKYHIHVFFPMLMQMEADLRLFYKQELFDYFAEDLVELGRLDTQLVSNSHQIRAEYGLYEKKYLNEVYKENVFSNDAYLGMGNEVPKEVVSYITEKLKNKKPLITVNKAYNSENMPECVKKLLSQDFTSLRDGRDRALFFFVWWFKVHTKTENEWKEQINRYNKYILNNYANDYTLDIKIEYSKKTNRNFSHRFVHDLLRELGIKHECLCERSDSFFTTGDADDKQLRGTGE